MNSASDVESMDSNSDARSANSAWDSPSPEAPASVGGVPPGAAGGSGGRAGPPQLIPSPAVRRMRWALLALVVTTTVLCVMISLAVYGLYRQGANLLGDVGAQFSRPQPTAALTTTAVILDRIAGASELATAVYTMEVVVTETRDRELGLLTLGRTELLYVAHGQVRAGVDLAQLDPAAVELGEVVTVRLPPPQILDQKIDVERSYVYDMRRSLLGPADPDLQSRAERFALAKIVRAACEGGILEEANTRAELVVRTLLEAASVRPVRVVTRQPESDCIPAAP